MYSSVNLMINGITKHSVSEFCKKFDVNPVRLNLF